VFLGAHAHTHSHGKAGTETFVFKRPKTLPLERKKELSFSVHSLWGDKIKIFVFERLILLIYVFVTLGQY